MPAEQKERQAAKLRGRKDSAETRLRKKAASQARSEEQRQGITARWAGEWGERMRETMRSPEYRAAVSKGSKGISRPNAYKNGRNFAHQDRSTFEAKRVAGVVAANKRPEIREKRRQARLGGPNLCDWTPEMRAKQSVVSRGNLLAGVIGAKRGTRWALLDRLGRYWKFRSSYELHAAEALDRLELTWLYEPVKLLLSDGRIYIPDFWVAEHATYVEVKGWKGWGAEKIDLAQQDGHKVVTIGDITQGDAALHAALTRGDSALHVRQTVANADARQVIDDVTRGGGDPARSERGEG